MGYTEAPTLVTARLRLRALRKGDLDDYAALHADPEVLRYMSGGPEPWDHPRSARHLAYLMGDWEVADCGMWAVEHRETGELVGVTGFSGPPGWLGFELAWRLARRFWGYGFATESARAAMDYAFQVVGKDHLISFIHPENRASIRVAERLGESLQGEADLRGAPRLRYGLDRQSYLRLASTAA